MAPAGASGGRRAPARLGGIGRDALGSPHAAIDRGSHCERIMLAFDDLGCEELLS
jgi:hypothetical protein